MSTVVLERSAGGRLVVWTQWALFAAFLTGSFGVLLMAVVRTGDTGALLEPTLTRLGDPKDSLPALWEPFAALFGLAYMTALLARVLSIVLVVLGLVAVARSRRAGDRATLRWSLAGTVAWAGVLALVYTPYWGVLLRWLLD